MPNDALIWLSFHKDDVEPLCAMVKERYPRDYSVACEIIENASLNLDIQMDDFMSIIFTLALIKTDKEENNGRVGLILCHGYSTASSIADTANHLLHEHIFDGIDMELKISIDKIVQLVDDYLKQKSPIQELILLVDMGSLEAIYEMISLSNCNIGLMNYVSTATALEVGHLIQPGQTGQRHPLRGQRAVHPLHSLHRGHAEAGCDPDDLCDGLWSGQEDLRTADGILSKRDPGQRHSL